MPKPRQLKYPTRVWIASYDKLKAHFEEHGNWTSAASEIEKDKLLFMFANRQRRMYREFYDMMKKPDNVPDALSEVKIKLLQEIQFDFDEFKQEVPVKDRWDENFEKLRVFKSGHGHCNIPVGHELHKFVLKQKSQYRFLKEGKPCKLTAARIQKLVDLGLSLKSRDKFYTWEERLEQLREFKRIHSHLCVPVSDPLLGKFVTNQRFHYSNTLKGEKHKTISESKIRQLTELGFVFQAGPKKLDRAEMKSWEGRFEELLEFKEKYGHSSVPKGFKGNPTLAGWVKAQRFEYRRMKNEKRTQMTHERALKLTEIGFDWDPKSSKAKVETSVSP